MTEVIVIHDGIKVNPSKPRKPKKQPATDGPAIRVVIEPLPEPPDMAERLSKIYALAARRYREHHGEKAVR